MDSSDADLLQEFVRSGSQAAFAELVDRHVATIRAAAIRQVRDPHLAEDVTQAVLIVLSKRARSVPADCLVGWLLTTTRYCARDALRARNRREHYEHEAAAMKPTVAAPSQPSTDSMDHEIAERLDEAMTKLRPKESTAIGLRYLENKPMAEVASAMGMTVDAVQKVIGRTLPKLRSYLSSRGVMLSSIAGLSDALLRLSNTSPSIPTRLAPTAQSISIAKGAMTMMRLATLKTVSMMAAAVLVLAGGAGVAVMNAANAAGPAPAPASPPAAVATPNPAPSASATEAAPAAVAANNLVGFNSPFLELVGCRIKQKLTLRLPPAAGEPVKADWYEQQAPEIRWTVDDAIAAKTQGYKLAVSLDGDTATPKPVQLDAAARVSTEGPLEPGDYTVRLSATGADGHALAESAAHVSVKPLPYTQIAVNDLQPDASIHFVSVQQSINESAAAIQNGGFINSDFVQLEKMFDDSGAPLAFTSTHKNSVYQYRYRLERPIEPGQPLMLASTGTETNVVKKVGGVYFYTFDHTPGGNGPCRRIELHRLPAGATLISTTPADLPHKIVEGHEQIFVDVMIPPGGHNLVAYRYRLATK